MQVTPYCPITSDGKAPNLEPFVAAVAEAIVAAARKAQRAAPRARQVSQKDVRRGYSASTKLQFFYQLHRSSGLRPATALIGNFKAPRGCIGSRAARSYYRHRGGNHHTWHAHGQGLRANGRDVQQGRIC